MTLSRSQRLDLYERIKGSSLGKEGADIVMNAIPSIDWTDLATHSDLALTRSELRGEMAQLRGEMAQLRNDVRLEIAALEPRLQRTIITWVLAAQGVTLATISVLVTVLAVVT